eukprot:3879746-Amphidinium_carterae.1
MVLGRSSVCGPLVLAASRDAPTLAADAMVLGSGLVIALKCVGSDRVCGLHNYGSGRVHE